MATGLRELGSGRTPMTCGGACISCLMVAPRRDGARMASVLAVCSISCSAMNRIAKLDDAAIVTMCEHAQSPKTNQEPRFFLARTDEAKERAPLSPALPSLRRSAPAAAQAGRTAAAQAGRTAAAQAGRTAAA
jgi:hypothetical protein